MRLFDLLICVVLTNLSCNRTDIVKIDSDIYRELIGDMIIKSETENERSKYNYKEAIIELDSPTKARLISLRSCFVKLDSSRIHFNSMMKEIIPDSISFDRNGIALDIDDIGKIRSEIIKNNNDISNLISNVIKDNFNDFRFDEELKNEYLRKVIAIKKSISNDEILDDENSTSDILLGLLLQSFHEQCLKKYEDVLDYLTYSRTYCGFEMYFPVVIENGDRLLYVGDSLKMRIGIGSYSSLVSPENTIIVVNNDTLKVVEDGTASFSKELLEAGKNRLNIECFLITPLTGEVNVGESEYLYEVF